MSDTDPITVRVTVWPTDDQRFDSYKLESVVTQLLRKLKGDGAAIAHYSVEVDTDDSTEVGDLADLAVAEIRQQLDKEA